MKAVLLGKSAVYLTAPLLALFLFNIPIAFGLTKNTSATTGNSLSTSASSTQKTVQQKTARTKEQERLALIITERAKILGSRYGALSSRLEQISNRIYLLLGKLDQEGTDMIAARMLLETADSKIGAARTRANQAVTTISSRGEKNNGTASDLYKIENQIIKPEMAAANKAFQDAKNALADVLSAIPQK